MRRPSARSASLPLLEPCGVVGVGTDGVVLGSDRERAVGPATPRTHRDDLDVLAGHQPLHRAGQRRVPEHDDALDSFAELGTQQQPVGADRALPRPGPTGRLGQQRPVRPLGQLPRRRPRVVAGDHDRRGTEREVRSDSSAPRIVRPACAWSDVAGSAQMQKGRTTPDRDQRVVELAVEVDRAVGEPGGVEGVGGRGRSGRRSWRRRRRAGPGRWSGWRRCRAAGPAGRR